MEDAHAEIYYLKITDAIGRVKLMLPQPQMQNGIDISRLAPGTYFLEITDQRTKKVSTKTFVKQ